MRGHMIQFQNVASSAFLIHNGGQITMNQGRVVNFFETLGCSLSEYENRMYINVETGPNSYTAVARNYWDIVKCIITVTYMFMRSFHNIWKLKQAIAALLFFEDSETSSSLYRNYMKTKDIDF